MESQLTDGQTLHLLKEQIRSVFNSELCQRLYERINQDHTQFLNNYKLADVAI
jgi:hypothetical protein